MHPRVSVLMTAHNPCKYLNKAVASILNQTFDDCELVLVDNGSKEFPLTHQLKLDDRLRLIRLEANVGRTGALIIALEASRGDFIAILDSDDLAYGERLAKQVSVLELNEHISLVGSRVTLINAEGVDIGVSNGPIGFVSHDELADRNTFVHSSLMFRRSQAIQVGGYDSRFQYAQDYDLILKLATLGSCLNLAEHLTKLRLHSESLTNSSEMQLVRIGDEATLAINACRRLTVSPAGIKANRRRQALIEVERCVLLVQTGRITQALKSLVTALRLDRRQTWLVYLVTKRRRKLY